MKKFDLIISMRKHIIIFADMLNIPFIALDNDPAMSWILRERKKSQFIIRSTDNTYKIRDKILNVIA